MEGETKRVGHGGARQGAGRKATGRKPRTRCLSDVELIKVDELIASLRAGASDPFGDLLNAARETMDRFDAGGEIEALKFDFQPLRGVLERLHTGKDNENKEEG